MTVQVDFAEAGGYLRPKRGAHSDGRSLLFTLADGIAPPGAAVVLWPSWLAPREAPSPRSRSRSQVSQRRE
ncbi:MAG TPA: hypothetical protein VFF67_03155 [Thermoplasmata archaeon]|nr:hypothetical protein [Thermoplasmata archaeon]